MADIVTLNFEDTRRLKPEMIDAVNAFIEQKADDLARAHDVEVDLSTGRVIAVIENVLGPDEEIRRDADGNREMVRREVTDVTFPEAITAAYRAIRPV